MIEVRNLSKRFGNTIAVDKLSFSVPTGQTLALIGSSGCGKTTTLKMINRLVCPTEGEVWVDGKNIAEETPEAMRRQMGYVIQDTGLFPHYTVAGNIGLVPGLLGWPQDRIRERTDDLLHQLGLPPDIFREKRPGQLSGGQQQRVGIARALAADPPILLMDEPFGALDPITRRQLRRDFRELEELAGKTTIIVTHDVEEAFELAELVCLLDKGQVQQLGTPRELLFHPANDFIVAFLAQQRLQLELEVVKIKDLMPFIRENNTGASLDTFPVNAEDNLRKVLAGLEKRSGKLDWQGKTKYFNWPALMQAFYDFQREK